MKIPRFHLEDGGMGCLVAVCNELKCGERGEPFFVSDLNSEVVNLDESCYPSCIHFENIKEEKQDYRAAKGEHCDKGSANFY